jgi:hypothetical protein
MWQRTGPFSASDGTTSVRWLDYNYGVEYRDGTRTTVIGAEFGGNELSDAHGKRRVTLYMGLDPGVRWNTGEALSDTDASRVLSTAREALEWMGFVVHMDEARPEYGRWFLQSLPWPTRLRFLAGLALWRIRRMLRRRP